MALYFLDSSALVKRYHSELGTAELDRLMAMSGNHFIISRLALVEVPSGLARLVREGTLAPQHFNHITARLSDDIANRVLRVAALNRLCLEGATGILGSCGLTYHVRTLDAIQLATALGIHARRPLTALVAADRRLLDVAANACNFTTIAIG